MEENRWAYLFLEIVVIITVFVFCSPRIQSNHFFNRRFVYCLLLLFVLWTLIDQLALKFELWSFPIKNTIGLRFLDLPLEEYLLFVIHTFLCMMLLQAFKHE